MNTDQDYSIKLRHFFVVAVCTGMLGGCVSGGSQTFSYVHQNSPNTVCADQFGIADIQVLRAKMPILPGQMPTRAMLDINETPTAQETRAITLLDTAIHNCQTLRATAGHATSASEDILEVRVGKLRRALSNGEIPYAVYNYGLAKILKRHAAFMAQGE